MYKILSKEEILNCKTTANNSAILFFLLDGEEVVYISKSIGYNLNLQNHFKNKKFDAYSVVEVDEEDIEEIYTEYVEIFAPKYNSISIPLKGIEVQPILRERYQDTYLIL